MDKIINESVPHIGEYIFGLLSGPEICACRLVCKSWNEFLVNKPRVWTKISEEILKSVKNKSSQQWQIILDAIDTKNEARNVCLMLLWWQNKCREEGTTLAVSPYVTSFDYPSSLKYLLSLSHEKNPIDDYGAGILHLAAVYGSLTAIKLISSQLEDKNPPATKLSYYTPLHFATVQNHVECIEHIVQNCQSPSPKAYLGRTPLHIAAEQGHLEAVKCLLKYVSDKNPALDEDGMLWTPLHYACDQGHLEIVKVLISELEASSLTMTTVSGWTPLHFAVDSNQIEIVRYLCSVLDDPNAQTVEGWTCAHIAVKRNYLTCLTILSEHKKINLRLKDNAHQTPFFLAIELEREKIVDFLMDESLKE